MVNAISQFLLDNAALLLAAVALAISLRANATAQRAQRFNEQARASDQRNQFAAKKRETLNELDLQYTRMATLSMITSQKILLFKNHPAIHQSAPDEFARLKNNLDAMERMRAKYEEHRKSVEDIGLDADLARQEEVLAKSRRMTIHIEKDIAHEQVTLEYMLKGLSAQ